MNTATLTQIFCNNLEPKRTPNGGLVPVIGTPLQTPYGAARVVGYDDGSLKVEITDYTDSERVVRRSVTGQYKFVDFQVAELAKARNRGLQCLIETIKRCSTEPQRVIADRIEAIENSFYNDLQFRFQISPNVQLGSGTLYHIEPEIITDDEQRRLKALEVREARRLAKQLLEEFDNTATPDDVAEEIEDAFGDEF